MARFNEILVGRYNRFMQKLLSMKGAASLVTLSDELFVAFPLFNGAENRYLEAWDTWIGNSLQSASVGNVDVFRLSNPSGSNVIAVVEQLIITAAATDTYFISSASNAAFGTTDASASQLDSRGRSNPTLILSHNAQASSITGGLRIQNPQNTIFSLIQNENQEMPILPGFAITVSGVNANQTEQVAWQWRERFLEESERT